jgi:hypothetical protein
MLSPERILNISPERWTVDPLPDEANVTPSFDSLA